MRLAVFLVLASALVLKPTPLRLYDRPFEVADQSRDQPIVFTLQKDFGSLQIHRVNSNGSNLKILTSNDLGNTGHPVWSPNGRQIAFDASKEVTTSAVYIMNADGSRQKRITDEKVEGTRPVWSPDGKKILMNCMIDDSPYGKEHQICVIDANGLNFKVLTNLSYNSDPAWSWDGTKIAFVSLRDGKSEIYIMNPDGSEQTRLTTTSSDNNWPVWSPDGKRVIFSAWHDKSIDIYSVNGDASGLTNLTNDAYSRDPVWSPNGRYMAFTSGFDLGIMRFDGTKPTIVQWFGIGGGFSSLAWSPDSTQLAFVSKREDPSLSSIYILPIACMFDPNGCTEDSITQVKPKVRPYAYVSDWPSYLNWAYSPAPRP